MDYGSRLLADGTVAQGVAILAESGKVSDFQNMAISIARGLIPGGGLFRKIGRNPDIDNVKEDLWPDGGAYVLPPDNGIQMSIASSSADDTLSGTGVRQVTVIYLNSSGIETTTTVNMNGTSAELTVPTDISRVQGFYAKAEGALNGAAGRITLKNVAGSVTYASIEIGDGKDRQAIWTVPAGKRAVIVETLLSGNASGGGGADYLEGYVRATCDDFGNNLPSNVFNYKSGMIQTNSGVWVTQQIPIVLPAGSVAKLSVVSRNSTSNVLAVGGFAGWYENV